MKRRELLARWNARDHQYALLKHGITPEMTDSVRANRLWEIDQLESEQDRQVMLAILSQWRPRHEVMG